MLQDNKIEINNAITSIEEDDDTQFSKSLGIFDAVAIISGSMIGSGIFIVSAETLRQIQSPVLLLIIWAITGIMSIAGGLCFGELAVRFPEAGGQYVYLKKAWGNLVGFLYGWTFFLVIESGAIAAVSVAFAKFIGRVLPFISTKHYLLHSNIINISYVQVLAIALIFLITYINMQGVQWGALVQKVFTSTKIVALVAILICGLTLGLNMDVIRHNFLEIPTFPTFHMNIFSAVAAALVGALFAADSWNSGTFVAAEMKEPTKDLPKALFWGILAVVSLYFLTNVIYLSVLNVEQIKTAAEDIVGIALMKQILGTPGIIATAIVIAISAFGAVNGMVLTGARVYYAMAKDGLFFKGMAKLNHKTAVPQNAIIAQCIWASFLTLSGSFSQLLDYVIFAALFFYILTVGGLFIIRKKDSEPFDYKGSFYPFLPALYCTLAGFTAVNLLIYKTEYSLYGLLIILSGVPIYFFWRYKNRKKLSTK
ncbi:MAG: amino acid permease [bacterium]